MCSMVLVHRFLGLFNRSSVFQGFDAPVLRYSLSFVHDLERRPIDAENGPGAQGRSTVGEGQVELVFSACSR
jgi:hypothetical protein